MKSCLGPSKGRNSYQFTLASGYNSRHLPSVSKADIFALVALNVRRVYFMPVKYTDQFTMRLQPDEFHPYIEDETWSQAVRAVIGTQWSD